MNHETWLLQSESGRKLYHSVKDLPIIDYHCHLSPKEIWEDQPFDNIGEMWLAHDHYKWRLMREYGIDERYITGDAAWEEKFFAYAQAIATAAGNPLYHWTQLELERYFGIARPLNKQSSAEIYSEANRKIKEQRLSPRKLMLMSKVEAIATTDDIADTLEYHALLSNDPGFKPKVTPSFRTDALLNIHNSGYLLYIHRLSDAADVNITDLPSLKQAVVNRLDFFVNHGCRFTDMGVAVFPNHIADDTQAGTVFCKALSGEKISDGENHGFLGNMFLFLAREYRKRGLAMQWHLSSIRNRNSALYRLIGSDCGVDCMGDLIPAEDLLSMLDTINENGGLPKTILYTLNDMQSSLFSVIAGCFPNVVCGAPWWFCDHKNGIIEQINNIAQTAHLGTFLGMLTDSRSFLSYTRHDYFRRIFCNIVGKWIDDGEFADDENALRLARAVCYENIKILFNSERMS